MNTKTIIGTLATIVGLAATAQADPIVKAEVWGNQKGTLEDLKLGTDVQTGPVNTQVFVRNRLTLKYDGSKGNFMNNQLRIGDLYGFGVTAQVRAITAPLPENPEQYGLSLVPQGGVIYTAKGDAWRFAADATAPATGSKQMEFLFNESYTPLEQVVLEKEDLVVLGNGVVKGDPTISGIKGSTRAHVGYKAMDLLTLGVAGEIDYGTNAVPDQRAGVFVRMGR